MHTIHLSEKDYLRMTAEHASIWAGEIPSKEERRIFSYDSSDRMRRAQRDIFILTE